MSERASLPPVCILAGGVGSRLGSKVAKTPKPLLEVAGEPFLMHQLRLLASFGVSEVVICVGYLGKMIEQAVGSERFGIRVEYTHDEPDLNGTLGAVRRASRLLGTRFLVLYGDSYLRIDYGAAAEAWRLSRLPAMMTVFHNEGRWDASNARFDGGRVVAYDKCSPAADMAWIDYGLGGLTTAALAAVDEHASDLSTLYHALAARGELFGYEAQNRFYEIGTPQALAEADAFLRGVSSAEVAPGADAAG